MNRPRGLAEVARLTERSFYVDEPHGVYARLRSEAPVWWCEEGNFWALTRHADLTAVAAQPSVWSSAYGSFLPDAKYPEKVRSRGVANSSLSFGSDPPHHTQYRRLISAVFTPQMVRQVEPMVRRVVTTALDGITSGEIVDVVDSVSVPTSINVIAALLGVPVSDWADFKRWSDALSGHLDALPGTEEEQRLDSQMHEMETYLLAQLDHRLRHPQEDWLTAIATMRVDGEPTPPAFQLTFARALLVAGNETTRNTISGGVIAFAEHPDQLRRLHHDSGLLDAATDEVVRWTSVIHAFLRRAMVDTEVRGQRIAEGDYVGLFFPAANRDESTWPDAHLFDITRKPTAQHLAYSWGPHRCLGVHLANLEIKVVLGELARRFDRVELAGGIRRRPSTVVDTYESVPVIFPRPTS